MADTTEERRQAALNESAKEREKRVAKSRKRGGRNANSHKPQLIDSYLPKRPYSEERVKPWEM